jgi:hypothetical protein
MRERERKKQHIKYLKLSNLFKKFISEFEMKIK